MQITLRCGFGGTQFSLLHMEASASINPEEGKPAILGLPLDISLAFFRHLCCLLSHFKHRTACLYVEIQSPQPMPGLSSQWLPMADQFAC